MGTVNVWVVSVHRCVDYVHTNVPESQFHTGVHESVQLFCIFLVGVYLPSNLLLLYEYGVLSPTLFAVLIN